MVREPRGGTGPGRTDAADGGGRRGRPRHQRPRHHERWDRHPESPRPDGAGKEAQASPEGGLQEEERKPQPREGQATTVPVPRQGGGPSEGRDPQGHDDAGENQVGHRGRDAAPLQPAQEPQRGALAFGRLVWGVRPAAGVQVQVVRVGLGKAGPFYPSTKRCSACGSLQEMPLWERTYSCPACGLVVDRDLNAARNLARVAASSAETENACGEMASRVGNDPEPPQGIRNLTGIRS